MKRWTTIFWEDCWHVTKMRNRTLRGHRPGGGQEGLHIGTNGQCAEGWAGEGEELETSPDTGAGLSDYGVL